MGASLPQETLPPVRRRHAAPSPAAPPAGCRPAHRPGPPPSFPGSLIGRAAHAIQEYSQAELAYRKALEVGPQGGWLGQYKSKLPSRSGQRSLASSRQWEESAAAA